MAHRSSDSGTKQDRRGDGRSANERVGIIGAGRTGTALAWHCSRLGYRIAGVTDKRAKQAWIAYGLLKKSYERLKASEVAARSDVLLLTTPDANIGPVFVAVKRWLRPKAIVVHCSGVLGVEVFKGAAEQRLETLALHPIQSFSSHAQAIQDLAGSFFALEGTARGLRFGRKLVRQLGGGFVTIEGRNRPLYHAMCVFASNFENVLVDAAETIADKLGISRRRAARMLAPLMRTVLENAVEYGASSSLTGPIQRGDDGTVAQHLAALQDRAPELTDIYRVLSLRLVESARCQGLSSAAAGRLRKVLER
ncbi:MAG: DUF2520 domain-containing protein [candidate division WOR-3 bacterium]|nr:MAG: DUF2520 domain-containing protein [candidate division WOR-3 bacterium]